MNVLSKFSTKGSGAIRSFRELGYNKCDNTDCNYRNSLQPVEGRFVCLGPATNVIPAGGSKLFKTDSPQPISGTAQSDDNSCLEKCRGTYLVTPEQAEFVSHLARTDQTDDSKRAEREVKAAVEARYRAQKLAAEVKKDFERELVLRKARAKEQARKQELKKEYEPEASMDQENMSESQDHSVPQDESREPVVRRLKRETRRLPVIKRDPSGILNEGFSAIIIDNDCQPSSSVPSLSPATRRDISENSSSQPATPPLFLHRRLSGSKITRPKQTSITWDSSIPTLSDLLRNSSRRAQYPPARGRMHSLDSILGTGGASDRSIPQPRVSTKNGMTITHFGALLPTTRRPHGAINKENEGLGQRRRLVLESRNKHMHRSDANRSTSFDSTVPPRRRWL